MKTSLSMKSSKKSESSKGAFYVHFSSKDEMFLDKFKEIDLFYFDFISNLPKEIDVSEKIIRFVKNQMIYIEKELGKDLVKKA